METEKKFKAAVNVIQNLPKDGSFQPSNEMKLSFYGHYKQATQGPCKQSRPGFWDIIGRAKHDAWAALGDMSTHQAMNGYVDLLTQIVETMKLSADVETFIEVLGPFYDYVEDKLSPDKSLKEASSALSEVEAATDLDRLYGLAEDGEAGPDPREDEERTTADENEIDEEDENEVSLEPEGLLGQFMEEEGVSYSNTQPDQAFIDQIISQSNGGKVTGTFARSYLKDQILSQTLTTRKTDLNHNSFHHPDTFMEELIATKTSIQNTKNLLQDIHRMRDDIYSSKTRTFREKILAEENIVNVSNELSSNQINRLLDRFEGYVPSEPVPTTPSEERVGADKPTEPVPTTPREERVGADKPTGTRPILEIDMNDESDNEIFEDTLDFEEQIGRSPVRMEQRRGEGNRREEGTLEKYSPNEKSSSQMSTGTESTSNTNIRTGPAPAPRRIPDSVRRELEREQILLVSTRSQPSSSLSSPSRDIDRFMENIVSQLNEDIVEVNSNLSLVTSKLVQMTTSLDHMTARLGGLETNLEQMNSRISTMEYLLQVLLRRESWFERQTRALTLPLLGCTAMLLFVKVVYDRRR